MKKRQVESDCRLYKTFVCKSKEAHEIAAFVLPARYDL